MNKRLTSMVFLIGVLSNALAYTLHNETAFTVDGFEIPIQIMLPEKGEGPFPVIYHVHGGGWNGGTATEVPGASLPPEAKILSDELGIVYVGLAYRCKLQGTFQDALEDIHQSIDWFETHAEQYNADVTRVGLSGGSAGTPLSALVAQQLPQCKTYMGLFGVYDFTNNEESLFPNDEALEIYGLADREQQVVNSAYHNLSKQPPATLLFHGQKDILTHPNQSIRFGKKLKEAGAEVEVVIYPESNHGYFNPRNPDEYKDSVARIAQLYAEHLNANGSSLETLNEKTSELVDHFYPIETITNDDAVGMWKGKNSSIKLNSDGTGTIISRKGKSSDLSYAVKGNSILITNSDSTIPYFMPKDKSGIYFIYPDGRFAGRKEYFNRQ